MRWVENVRFVSDTPGKNEGTRGLGGGGATTDELMRIIKGAKREIMIQTPYLVMTEMGRELFADAVRQGVTVKVLTNSLAATDNLDSFSGYKRDRDKLLDIGVEVYEWRPDAAIGRSLMSSVLTEQMDHQPVFGLHVKTMVVDESLLVVGTFNLDPRSADLNTECITIIPSGDLARRALTYMNEDIHPENAWRVTKDSNPDEKAGSWRRLKLFWRKIIPKSIL